MCYEPLEFCLIKVSFKSVCTSTSEKAMAPHSSTFAWKIPWTEEPGRLQSMGSLESDTTERPHFHFSLSCIGEGNGNPLQCSCLENPRDGEAWWAAVYGVAQSRTRLKQPSSSSSSSSTSTYGVFDFAIEFVVTIQLMVSVYSCSPVVSALLYHLFAERGGRERNEH